VPLTRVDGQGKLGDSPTASSAIPAGAPAEVVAVDLAFPLFGPRRIAAALRQRTTPIVISASTIRKVLQDAGLATQRERVAACESVNPAATV
jgi:hypothetical protein